MTSLSAPRHWLTWGTARGYSLSATEERDLLEEFRQYTGEKPDRPQKTLPDRQVASLMLTLLRDGASPADLEAIAPDLDPRDLESVYVRTAEKLHEARGAWQELVEDPQKFDDLADTAGRLMPHLINSLRVEDPEVRTEMLRAHSRNVEETTRSINELERKMHKTANEEDRRNLHYSLARADSCLWDDTHFLPDRVGQLTPTRLAFVLGELS